MDMILLGEQRCHADGRGSPREFRGGDAAGGQVLDAVVDDDRFRQREPLAGHGCFPHRARVEHDAAGASMGRPAEQTMPDALPEIEIAHAGDAGRPAQHRHDRCEKVPLEQAAVEQRYALAAHA
jgi:hypothetical protein